MNDHKLTWAKKWLEQPKKIYIGGEWAESHAGKRYDSTNPANEKVLSSLVDGCATDVDYAVEQARQALSGKWSGLSRRERAQVLHKIGELVRQNHLELATLESLDNGKTFVEAVTGDLPDCSDVFDYYAGWTDKVYGETCPVESGFLNYTQRDPVGVCALIVPWNFPLLLAMWKLAPALAMGNTVVIKPAPFTSLSLLRFAELVHESNLLPPGVLNVVTGGAEVGKRMASHPRIDKISFTGSTAVGKSIVQSAGASNLKSVALELGGKSPNIIFDDAVDLPEVIERSFALMFSQKGEKCTEPTRFFLHEKIYDQVAESLIEKATAIKCGDPFDSSTDQGPQCHLAHMEKILDYIRLGKEEGARLLVGGERDVSGENSLGYFVRPTIFGDVDNRMTIAQEEIFGPVLCLIRFKEESDVIAMANDSIYGLAAGVYTADQSRAHRVANALESGMVFVNHYGCYHFSSPFGGLKQSGWGREMARHSIDEYTKLKSIWIKT